MHLKMRLATVLLAATAFTATAQIKPTEPVPIFEVDPTWPQLPNGWVLGVTSKVAVDSHDNVWIIHRPRTVPAGQKPAPPVIELDAHGKFIRAWGGDGPGYDWPNAEHNVLVDSKDNVYITGSSPSGQSKTKDSDDMLLKFTVDGKFIKQFGGRTVTKGSTDPASVNKPGDIFIWPKTNELFIADGYGNRRVLVLDAETLAYKRMWGAFGKPPVDDATSGGPGPAGEPVGVPPQGRPRAATSPIDPNDPGPDHFSSPVHGVLVSNDGIVYVADRSNQRVQLFTPAGKYLTQMFINRGGPAVITVTGMAFSADKAQRFLYLSDYGNSRIEVVDRKTLKILYEFGGRGKDPGQFQGIHLMAADHEGNLYTAEVVPGARTQRFIFKGLSSALPPNALPPVEPVKPSGPGKTP